MKETLAKDVKELPMSVPTRYQLSNIVQIQDIQLCFNSQNKINLFIPSEQNSYTTISILVWLHASVPS